MSGRVVDLCAVLARALGVSEGEDARACSCLRGIGSGPGHTHYLDLFVFQPESTSLPEYWYDHFAYELKKYERAQSTLVFENSRECGEDRYQTLYSDLIRVWEYQDSGLPIPSEFEAISFQFEPYHDVLIFVVSATS